MMKRQAEIEQEQLSDELDDLQHGYGLMESGSVV